MPYIDPQIRASIAPELNALKRRMYNMDTGTLNYVITKLLIAWMGPKPGYTEVNTVIGALGCVSLELYRRMAAPYEDVKRGENGDVFPPVPLALENKSKGDTPHERE